MLYFWSLFCQHDISKATEHGPKKRQLNVGAGTGITFHLNIMNKRNLFLDLIGVSGNIMDLMTRKVPSNINF